MPYGNKSPETIVRYSLENLAYLRRHDVKAVVVACNTASAHALAMLQKEADMPVIGVIAPGVEAALAATRNGRIGVIGTQGTIQSGAYQNLLRKLRPDVQHHRRGRAAAGLAGGGGLAFAPRHAIDPRGIFRADEGGAGRYRGAGLHPLSAAEGAGATRPRAGGRAGRFGAERRCRAGARAGREGIEDQPRRCARARSPSAPPMFPRSSRGWRNDFSAAASSRSSRCRSSSTTAVMTDR